MDLIETEIVVAGGGVAGLMAAMCFAARGHEVICVDPAPPVTDAGDPRSDLRSTAFLMPAVEMMDEIGLWPRLAPDAAELRVMRLCDSGGALNAIREQVDFSAEEIGYPRFGWNVPNRALRARMVDHAAGFERLDLRMGRALSGMLARTAHARLTLDDGTRISAQLVIAADGRDSFVRDAVGIPAQTTRYGQKGMVFAVSHPVPHDGVSTELHRTGGPFTLVPLPDAPDGTHRSAVVWMETGPKVGDLMALDAGAFSIAATERSCGILGPLRLEGERAAWPIITRAASALTAPRTALIAEAAHVMPPIGAQGLNTSFADIRALIGAAGRHGLGSPEMLADYAAARAADIGLREWGVDLLNRAALTEMPELRDLRRRGLGLLAGLAPLRRAAIRKGMGLDAARST